MNLDKKVPEIRFAGFGGKWDKKELGTDVADIIGGGTPSTSISEFWNGDIDWYSPTEIGDNVYAEGSQKKITALGLKSSSAKILPAGRTVLFTSRAGIGDMAILASSGATNQGFQSFVVKEGFSPYFIYSIGKQIKEFALKHASGSTFLEISGKQLGRMEILIPCEKEQATIGNYFQKLDSLINQHQQKHDKLSSLKKAMLEKMFPKQGETVPEIRFKGFSGEWKSTALAELALFNPREDLPASFKYVDLESVKGTSLIGYRKELKENAPSRAQRLAKKGDVFFQTVRPYQKNNYLFNKDDDDFVFSTGYAQLRPYYDGDFLLNLVQRDPFVKDVLDNCTGTSYPAINASILAGLRVQYPESKEEQAAIGSYFQKLDTLINQHQQQITKLTNIKQACLSKMFV
ncbi:restriction endonuclease subunit S [Vibrio sp. F74]|uniref:restriction endonuclease subunit S n=1 Tax=Vibrio sp. F74 TaxID=700020 RepID=UPI0035F5A37E